MFVKLVLTQYLKDNRMKSKIGHHTSYVL